MGGRMRSPHSGRPTNPDNSSTFGRTPALSDRVDYEYMPAAEVYSSIADKSTISRWIRQGEFPAGIAISARRTVFIRAEVRAAIAAKAALQEEIRAKRNAIGARLVRGRAGSRNAAANAEKDGAQF